MSLCTAEISALSRFALLLIRVYQLFVFVGQKRLRKVKNRQICPTPPLVGVEPNPGPKTGTQPSSLEDVGKHLSEKDRWRIVVLRDDIGLSPTEIAELIPTTRATVYYVLRKFDETGSAHDKPGRGRKHPTSLESIYQEIIQQRLPPAQVADDTPRRIRDKWVIV